MGKFNRPQPVTGPPIASIKGSVKKFNRQIPADPDHYERITNTGEKVCYVCDKPFKKKDNIMYDGTLSKGPHFGEKIYKHRKCNPFSIHWFHKFNGCPGLINNGGSYMLTKKYKRKHHQQELDIESLIKGGEET